MILEIFELITVVPGVFNAQRIIQDLTCALPIFSLYIIGLKKSVPDISKGNLLVLLLIFAPKSLKGLITLEKSLLDKLLSPINFTLAFDLTNNPKISGKCLNYQHLLQFFFKLKLLIPKP